MCQLSLPLRRRLPGERAAGQARTAQSTYYREQPQPRRRALSTVAAGCRPALVCYG